eukprot:Colp12_sorted_trinity150504_noHs@18567
MLLRGGSIVGMERHGACLLEKMCQYKFNTVYATHELKEAVLEMDSKRGVEGGFGLVTTALWLSRVTVQMSSQSCALFPIIASELFEHTKPSWAKTLQKDQNSESTSLSQEDLTCRSHYTSDCGDSGISHDYLDDREEDENSSFSHDSPLICAKACEVNGMAPFSLMERAEDANEMPSATIHTVVKHHDKKRFRKPWHDDNESSDDERDGRATDYDLMDEDDVVFAEEYEQDEEEEEEEEEEAEYEEEELIMADEEESRCRRKYRKSLIYNPSFGSRDVSDDDENEKELDSDERSESESEDDELPDEDMLSPNESSDEEEEEEEEAEDDDSDFDAVGDHDAGALYADCAFARCFVKTVSPLFCVARPKPKIEDEVPFKVEDVGFGEEPLYGGEMSDEPEEDDLALCGMTYHELALRKAELEKENDILIRECGEYDCPPPCINVPSTPTSLRSSLVYCTARRRAEKKVRFQPVIKIMRKRSGSVPTMNI